MRTLGDADLLALWERGATRHPLDRNLLLCSWARADLAPGDLPDLPLGVVNTALMRLRRTTFGARIEARVDCERCAERLEIALDASALAEVVDGGNPCGEIEVDGFRFRAPTTRDLAAIADAPTVEAAASALLDRCRVCGPPDAPLPFHAILPKVEASLETVDPAADVELALTCEACGHSWSASLDIGALLWSEIAARARTLLAEVHRLALTYGWGEREILGLSPARRAAYLQMVPA
jgi:hypothetical protein